VKRKIRRDVGINASAERVWSILTDFSAFAQWNPFIREIGGEPKVGARLDIYLQLGQLGARGC
jgi:uncharacterized protein YndB with AHSA1/START domain